MHRRVLKLLRRGALHLWLINSKGALAAFEQIDLQEEAASRSITQLVEKTRVSMGVGARGAGSGRSIMSPEYHENDKSAARLTPQTTTSAAAAYASAAKPTPAPSPPPPPTPKSAEEVAALVEAISDTAPLRRVAVAVRASGFDQSVAREFASDSECVAAIAERAGVADISGVALARLTFLFRQLRPTSGATSSSIRYLVGPLAGRTGVVLGPNPENYAQVLVRLGDDARTIRRSARQRSQRATRRHT